VRAIAPELVIVLALMLLAGVALVVVGAVQQAARVSAPSLEALRESHRAPRDRLTRRRARWEPATLTDRHDWLVLVTLVTEAGEVLRNDGKTVRVSKNDPMGLLKAQTDAQTRADKANREAEE
jgi:hypothetical protein